MRSIAVGFTVFLAAACGGDAAPTPEGIEGRWIFEHDDNVCATALLAEDGEYEIDTICQLTDGSYGAEGETGTYVVTGTKVAFTPTGSTCKDGDRGVDTASFERAGDQLSLVFPGGLFVFDPIESDGDPSAGSVAFGCYDDAGLFTPMPAVRY